MKYVLRKLTTLIITLFIVSLLAFLAFQVIPGSPATRMLGTNATPEKIAALEAELGFDKPVLVRYGNWMMDFVQGDWGTSYSYSMPVKDMILEKIPATATLVILAFLMVVLFSFPLGIATAKREGSKLDRSITVVNQICMSIPPVFVGILLSFVFGITLKVFVPGSFVTFSESPGQFLVYMIFPAIAVALSRTAIIAFLAVTAAELVAGTIVVEQVFAVPGVGRLLLASISGRDFPVAQAIVVLLAAWVVIVNFIADILYQYMDPRIRIS